MLHLVTHMIIVNLSPLYDDLRCDLLIGSTTLWNLIYAQQELGVYLMLEGKSSKELKLIDEDSDLGLNKLIGRSIQGSEENYGMGMFVMDEILKIVKGGKQTVAISIYEVYQDYDVLKPTNHQNDVKIFIRSF
ncbi:hypothetical protein L1887_29431 [Cichorium endivia]|nr:hypothetical protein L1887_29431 [Cichorium endivia]